MSDRCPCGGIILADSEDWKTPLCYECYPKEYDQLKASLIDAVKALEFFVIGNYSIMEVENLARETLAKLKSKHKFLGD